MKRAISVLAPVFLAFAVGLVQTGTASADSPIIQEARQVGAFHSITIAGALKVEVTVGKPARVELSGESDLLGKVTTTVKDGVLVIDTPKRLQGRNHLRATVTMPDLQSLLISGTADMKVTGVANAALAISVPGTGSLTIAGSTDALSLIVDGTGQITADKLAAKDARVEISGTGSASLRASQSIDVNVSGTGSVNVAGKPARVRKSVTGTASVQIR
jgi:hypothetical protein